MAQAQRGDLDTFMAVTGATEADALRKLEEHAGNLNEALNAHFNEGDWTVTSQNAPAHLVGDYDSNAMETDDPHNPTIGPSILSAHGINPFSLLDPTIRQEYLEGRAHDIFRRAPSVSRPRVSREIPIEVIDSETPASLSGQQPIIEDITGDDISYGPEIHGTVTMGDEQDDEFPGFDANIRHNASSLNNSAQTPLGEVDYVDRDVEEQILQAVIEASKKEVGGSGNENEDFADEFVSDQPEHMHTSAIGDAELARAAPDLMEIAEQVGPSGVSSKEDEVRVTRRSRRQGHVSSKAGTSRRSMNAAIQEELDDFEEMEEQPLVRRRSRRIAAREAESTESAEASYSSPSTSPQQNRTSNGFHSDEWGGITNEEHDEAVMLEAAMFGGIPEGASYQLPYPSNYNPYNYSSRSVRAPHPPSPSLTEQRLIREQQDDDYLAALEADREKETKALQEAEQRHLEELASREAALMKQKAEEEEKRKKHQEEQELESALQARKLSLPQEPSPDDENALTLVVRMPDGSRHGRRFVKTDKLQLLFDFLDTERIVKPGTYRLVRPFPRRAFQEDELAQPMSNLGLTSKLEALFLEFI